MTEPGSVRLNGLKLKSIKADLIAETVTLVLTGNLDDQMNDARSALQRFHTLAGKLDVAIQAQATQLPIATFGASNEDPFA